MSERVSPANYPAAIVAAQQRLLARRRTAGIEQHIAPAVSIGGDAPANSIAAQVQCLPDHLGWESAAVTAVLRRQNRTQRERGPEKQRSMTVFASVRPSTAHRQPPHPGDEPSTDIVVYPDVALGMLRHRTVPVGRLWLLLRHLDPQGQGCHKLEDVRSFFAEEDSPWRVCGRRHLRSLLTKGEGLFWEQRSDRLWLRSVARVAAALGIHRLTTRSVVVPANVLVGSIGDLSAHLYASFHSGGKSRPISRDTLSRITEVCGRTQRNYEQRAKVTRQANYAVGGSQRHIDIHAAAWQHGQALFTLRDAQGTHGPRGATLLAWQLPNSFSGPHDCGTRRGMKRINRRLAVLLNKGTTGNGQPEIEEHAGAYSKRYFANSGAAARAVSRELPRRGYWPARKSARHPENRCNFWYTIGGG